ncbi:MAG: hypothetical protein FJ125_11440, partial [Deltaproteobacteria bacterium]|nr:hypothetical protein [Deltaproteobacteria bacterium]
MQRSSMRHFSSYGPVNPKVHFALERRWLVEHCVEQLVGSAGEGGHYFTIHAPQQSGKTWLMRQAVEEIRRRHADRFLVGVLSLQGLMDESDPDERFLQGVGLRFPRALLRPEPRLEGWDDWLCLFHQESSPFDQPLILLIDEFDSLTRTATDKIVALFRQMYLAREEHVLHGLALIGVRAVLGVDSPRGSPFNVQRSLHVPNFNREEVEELFGQYQQESGQAIEPAVMEQLYGAVLGQPGLTCWFGELLTEKYNPDRSQPIDMARWQHIHARALYTERNNNILNLVAKARQPFAREVQTLFVKSDVPFVVGQPWCDHLDLNGIIAAELVIDELGQESFVCRFAS